MAVNKVVYGGKTVIDLTNDTVSPSELMSGVTAHGASGQTITGTFSLDTEISAQDNLIAQIKTALEGKTSGGGSSGGTTIETCSVYFNHGGNSANAHYATLSGNDIIVEFIANVTGADDYTLTNVIKNSIVWFDVYDTSDYSCTNAELVRTEDSGLSTTQVAFKITGDATIYG